MSKLVPPEMRKLDDCECRYFRDQFRAARYAALADAEGFSAICFALEALGLRLLGRQSQLGGYESSIGVYAQMSPVLSDLARRLPSQFKNFDALYQIVRTARNDAMHIGAYARHATEAAIELCIGLEEALMADVKRTVGNVMVKSPITVESWQPVAHARQVMLMHSFSFLPVWLTDRWCLVSELGLAKFLNVRNVDKRNLLGCTIEAATTQGLELVSIAPSSLLCATELVDAVLRSAKVSDGPVLWLVVDEGRENHLVGVLSPFELM